jgi:hypothetical protein
MSLCTSTTAKGKPCRNHAVRGTDKCGPHLGVTHRPTTFSQDVADKLVVMLRAGNYLHVAVAAAGVPMTTFKDWLRKGRSPLLVDLPFVEFRERVESARAEGEARMVAVIARAAQDGDWRAALSLLEREFPERWGPVSVRVREVEAPPAPEITPRDDDDPFREVDELAERRRSRTG